MSPEEKRSKLGDILREYHYGADLENVDYFIGCIEALFKQEEQLPDVHAGIDYRCIKDFYMDEDSGGNRAFTQGLVYNSSRVNHEWPKGISRIWFTDDAGKDHSISLPNKAVPFWEYFEEVN